MRKAFLIIVAGGLTALTFFSCSDPQEVPLDVQSEVSVHPEGWITVSSPNFHGTTLAARNFDTAECRQCHGNQFDGGVVEKSCFTCHAEFPHPQGWVGLGENSHSTYIQNNSYDFQSCKSCHGQDYSQVKIDNSCLTCHTNPDGPESCNTCHGTFAGDVTDLRNVAPPAGLNNETDPALPAVGAHQAHLGYFASAEMICQECHTVPENMAAAGHIDADGEADVVFQGVLAVTVTEGGARQPAPAYSHATNNCANAYCHGNWGLLKSASTRSFIYADSIITGNSATPVWTDPNTAACGTCHDLPPKGHNPFALDACTNCHGSVVDANGEIIDNSKHINGKVNVFGEEYEMF
jgi:predicted CxxxxCH...CXXCH cytochrome family protein